MEIPRLKWVTLFFFLGLLDCTNLIAQKPLRQYYPAENFIDNSSNYNWGTENRNINHDDGVDWQDAKRATAIIQAGRGFCSCTLMNNVKQDGRLLISTAAHCIGNNVGAEIGLILAFNYEMSDALERGDEASDITVTSAYELVGTVRMKDDEHDIALIELDTERQQEWAYSAYSAGYNASVGSSIVQANVSHPAQDHKKIFVNPGAQTFTQQSFTTTGGADRKGYFYTIDGGWNGVHTSPLKGSSGSGFYNADQELIAIHSTNAGGGYTPPIRASALSNALYREGHEDIQALLDPDQTWVNKVPGGYLHDLIPTASNFTLEIDPGVDFSTAGINPNDRTQLENGVHYIRPSVIFDLSSGQQDWERILGVNIPAPNSSSVVLSVYQIIWDVESLQYKEHLLYGAYANHNIQPNEPVSAGFRGVGWDCNNPPVGFPPCNRNTGFWLVDRPVDMSSEIKPSFARGFALQSLSEGHIESIWDSKIPVVIRLKNAGSEPVEVRAVSYPGEVPKNALQLFKSEELADQFISRKYRDNKGINSDDLHLSSLTVEQGAYSKIIQTGNNGGFINLVNPNFKIGAIKTAEAGESLKLTGQVSNTTGQPYTYKAWIDYYNTEQLDGLEVDNTYNFVLDPVPHISERLSVAYNITGDQFSFTVDIPSAYELRLDLGQSRLTRLRIEVSDKNNELPELIDVQNIPGQTHQGETEDYLIEIKAPTCNDLKPDDYETYAEAELAYCGDGSYRESKEPLADNYEESTAGSLTFNTQVASNIPYATATGFQHSFNGRNKKSITESVFTTVVHETISGEFFLKDDQLKMDVYYPVSNSEVSTQDLQALPLIVYAYGGGFVLNRDDQMGERMCQWLASKGYVVAAIDYRLGMNITNGELSKRAIIRAWQDTRAAVMYWRHNTQVDNGTDRWKIDPDKIFGLGFSAGAITVLHNMYLDQDTYESERALDFEGNPSYLTSTSSDYTFTLTNWSEIVQALKDFWSQNPDAINHINNVITQNKTYRTYDLDDYPTYPCIGPNSPCSPGSLTEAQEVELLNLMKATDGRFNKGVAFSGALAKTDWMINEQTRQVRFIQHTQDGIVGYLEDEPFSYLGDVVNIYNFATSGSVSTPKLSGGGSMLDNALEYSLTSFGGEPLSDLNTMAGGGIPYHRSMQKFGSSDKNDPEAKLLYYVDAVFTKASSSSAARLSSSVEYKPEEQTKEALFKVFPNPASDHVNIIVDLPKSSPLAIELVDIQGKTVYQMQRDYVEAGSQWVRLGNLGLPSGVYVIKLTAYGLERKQRLLIEKDY